MIKYDHHELKKIDGMFGKNKNLKSLQVRYISTFQHSYFRAVEIVLLS